MGRVDQIMSSPLEGIKSLMRGSAGLPDNMSEAEINHFSAELLKRLKCGESIETLELYLRRLKDSNSRQFQVSAATRDLAQRVVVFFNG